MSTLDNLNLSIPDPESKTAILNSIYEYKELEDYCGLDIFLSNDQFEIPLLFESPILGSQNNSTFFSSNKSSNENQICEENTQHVISFETQENPIKIEQHDAITFESQENPIKIEQQILLKKCGRIPKTQKNQHNSNHHSKYDRDNLIRKIKVKYLKYLLSVFNYLIEKEFKSDKYLIKKIDGKITQNITIPFNQQLFNLTLKKFFTTFQRSSKYKNISKNINAENIEIIYENQTIKKLLDMSYLSFYKTFFISKNSNYQLSKFIGHQVDFRNTLYDYHMIFAAEGNDSDYILEFMSTANFKYEDYFINGKPRKSKKSKSK